MTRSGVRFPSAPPPRRTRSRAQGLDDGLHANSELGCPGPDAERSGRVNRGGEPRASPTVRPLRRSTHRSPLRGHRSPLPAVARDHPPKRRRRPRAPGRLPIQEQRVPSGERHAASRDPSATRITPSFRDRPHSDHRPGEPRAVGVPTSGSRPRADPKRRRPDPTGHLGRRRAEPGRASPTRRNASIREGRALGAGDHAVPDAGRGRTARRSWASAVVPPPARDVLHVSGGFGRGERPVRDAPPGATGSAPPSTHARAPRLRRASCGPMCGPWQDASAGAPSARALGAAPRSASSGWAS